ncbi:MAG TPA: zinc-dependent peptidase [Pirellulales bacterium]|nr:zinc-dependent peptidase [Pirellulales bacterium]
MLFSSKKRRRQQLLAGAFPSEWLEILERNVRQYRLLSRAEQAKLRDRVRIFVAEKNWVGCAGLQVDDEMKVTVAAQACLLVLAIEHEYHYERIRSILVYPDTYVHPPNHRGWGHDEAAIAGEYWHRGPVVVSWTNTRERLKDGGNLVFHEFAHHLDDIDGEMDGVPPLENGEQERRWEDVVGREYNRLARDSARGQATLLDEYGATDRAEFFAVATECFFERPVALRQRHAELYRVLQDFYRQDPARWHWGERDDRAAQERGEPRKRASDEAASVEATLRAMRLQPASADAYFARGIMHANRGDFAQAVAAYDEAVRLAPDDGEILQHRGAAYLELGRPEAAIADASEAIRLDPDDVDAYRTRAAGLVAAGQLRLALDDCNAALSLGKKDAEAFRLRGLAKAGLRDLEGALADLGRSIRSADDPAQAYLDRSRVYEDLGMPHEARADRERALRLDPELDER